MATAGDDGFTLSIFLGCFVEYVVKEKGVKSFAHPDGHQWHEFLWNLRPVFREALLPCDYIGQFVLRDAAPKSKDVSNAMLKLDRMCCVRYEDNRMILYPDAMRIRFLYDPSDRVLCRSLILAFEAAKTITGLLEF